ncbi:MAG: PBP1A family penicillin-binding protein [Desulfobacterota bacterium]|nr:PBP1A family penicillin-binding protein [Thermodesulfobacteriota bacterium]
MEKVVKISITLVMVILTSLFVFGISTYYYFGHDLPSIENLKNYDPPTITRFFSDQGEIIGEFFVEKREVVSLERMPDHLIHAFIAGEDARFFQHKGVDYLAILRALFKNIFSGEIVQGGSTITQQVVKSLLLTPEKSVSRKIREAILSFKIERYLTKEEILYLYLNQIYLGHGAYGVASAAEVYFGKPVEELSLPESALLAGLPQAPSKYSPFHHPEQAKRRQGYILNRMVEEGFITEAEAHKALHAKLELKERRPSPAEKAPHFVDHVRKYVEERYGKEALYTGGLQVFTTLDLYAQRAAQEAVESGLREIEKRQKYPSGREGLNVEGALICFELDTGYVKAMVGGRNYKKSQFNRATQALRQTGSAFKPIVFASALDRGYTPASIVVDSPIVFEFGGQRWTPKNYDEKFSGPTTLRNALSRSINVVTVKIARDIGIDYIRDYARTLGITSPLHDHLAMALGSSSLSLFELTKAYAVFGNQGKRFTPIFIKKILDRHGNLLEENHPLNYPEDFTPSVQLISPQTAFLMTNLLESVVQQGTGWRAKALGRPVAAKTGTTDQFFDAWFIGYTPEFVTGVWVGFDEDRSLGEGETGARAASPIWVDFMSRILKNKEVRNFSRPDGIEFMKIDPKSGQISQRKEAILECFREGTGPYKKDIQVSLRPSIDFFKLDLNHSGSKK